MYDNPNYSHILIGGQPFFILPSGELSGHVPVPSQGERLTPRPRPPRQIYEGDGAALANYNLGKVLHRVADPDSIGSMDPDLGPYSKSGSGSRRAKMTQKSGKINKFHVLKCWMFSF